MPMIVISQPSFVAGELGSYFSERADNTLFHSAAQRIENMVVLPQGGLSRRPGFEFIFNAGAINGDQTALVCFDFDRDQQYVLFFVNLSVYIFRDKVLVATVTTPFLGSELGQLRTAQSGDTLLLINLNHPPQSLVRNGSDISWTLAPIVFKNLPYHRFNFFDTLTPSGTSGSITLTSSGPTFNAGHVGSHIHVNGGDVTITGYTSPTVLTGTVTGTLSGTGADTTWKEWAWSGGRGYPRSCCFHQNRFVIGGTTQSPETVYASVSGDVFNMDDNTVSGATITDQSSYQFTLSTDTAAQIRDMKSQIDLNIFSNEGEHQLNAGGSGAVTPTNVSVQLQSRYGVSDIRVIEIDGELIFSSASLKEIRSYVYEFDTNRYQSDNKTQLANSLFVDGSYPLDMAYLRAFKDTQSNIIAIPRQDGQLAVCSINTARQVLAWSRFTTTGNFKRVLSCVTDEGDGIAKEMLYAVVSRTNGVSLECLTESEVFVDCFYTGSVMTPKTTWTGSTQLDNMVVQVVGDGLVMPNVTVGATGSITVANPVADIVLGLGYVSTVVTNKFIPAVNGANMRGSRIRKISIIVSLLDTKSLTVDGYPVSFRSLGTALLDQPLLPYTGPKVVRTSGISEDSTVVLTVTEPLPCTVLNITSRFKMRGDLNMAAPQ